jgi:glycosyltransferase involved in cell wall biosynthesis
MKIGFINNSYYPVQFGGAERSVQLLAESVQRLGHRAAVLTMSPSRQREEGEVNGVPVVYVPHKNLYSPPAVSKSSATRVAWHLLDSYNPFMGAEVAAWLRRVEPDVVHTNVLGGFSVAAWDAARRHGVPLVHTLREYYLQCRLMTLNRGGVECASRCAFCRVCAVPRRARSSQPHAVVGISRHILESHLDAGFFSGVPVREVIFNAAQVRETPVTSKPVGRRLRLGFLGRIERLKGIDFLLEEVQRLPDAYELFVGGEGDTAYTREARGRALGIPVTWLGYVEPAKFFEQIDLFVVPSLWQEPFGRVIVESYGHGVPVLASRRGGIGEIVDEGVTGFLFDPSIPNDFRRALEGITAERCGAMAPACLEKCAPFEPDRIGRRYLDLFSRVRELAGAPCADRWRSMTSA